MKYNLEFLPSARKDMVEIIQYISDELKNPVAANQLADKLIEAAMDLQEFPYAYSAYYPIRPLKHEYRKRLVQNYLMFYWVDEISKTIVIASVVYAKKDYGRILE